MTIDQFTVQDDLIHKTPSHLLAIGYTYSKTKEEQANRDAIKVELTKRFSIFHFLYFIALCFFANIFFWIGAQPIQEGPLEFENGDLPKGIFFSIILYLILFLFLGFFFYQSHIRLRYIPIIVLGLIVYKTVKDILRYCNKSK